MRKRKKTSLDLQLYQGTELMKMVTALNTSREDIHQRDSVVEIVSKASPHFIDKRFDTREIGGMANHIGRLISIFVLPVYIWFASSFFMPDRASSMLDNAGAKEEKKCRRYIFMPSYCSTFVK